MEDVRYFYTDHLGRMRMDCTSDEEAQTKFNTILRNLRNSHAKGKGTLRIIKEVRTVIFEEDI